MAYQDTARKTGMALHGRAGFRKNSSPARWAPTSAPGRKPQTRVSEMRQTVAARVAGAGAMPTGPASVAPVVVVSAGLGLSWIDPPASGYIQAPTGSDHGSPR